MSCMLDAIGLCGRCSVLREGGLCNGGHGKARNLKSNIVQTGAAS